MNVSNASIPLEVVAAITAAISAVVEGPFVLTSIRPEPVATAAQGAPTAASAWAKVGLIESHMARRQFGLRSR